MTALIIIIVLIVLVAIFAVSIYNSLVQLRNQVKNAWAQIEVQLKRRHDLIPNLIETVKGYMKHERELLENVTKYRSQAMDAGSVGEKAKAEGMLSGALGQLRVQIENYPDLKANVNFLDLQNQLIEVEDQLQYSRRYYNGTVRSYNIRVESFPSNIVAGIFNFKTEEFFEITLATERNSPTVKI